MRIEIRVDSGRGLEERLILDGDATAAGTLIWSAFGPRKDASRPLLPRIVDGSNTLRC